MTLCTRNATPVAIAVAAAWFTACKGTSPVEGAPMRLTPAQVISDAGVDALRLVDRDTTTAVRLERPTRITLVFRRPVVVGTLKVHGASAVQVRASGLGDLVPCGEGGWSAASLPATARATLVLDLAPAGPGASLAEIEAWGPGVRAGRTDPATLAALTAPRAPVGGGAPGGLPEPLGRPPAPADDVLSLAAQPASAALQPKGTGGADCAGAVLEGGVAARSARRAYLVYEANVQRPVVLRRSVNGGAPAGGLWLAETGRRSTQVDELDPAKLTGRDEVLLCLPREATGTVTIDGLRLLLVLDSGWDVFDRDAGLVLGAAGDGDAATSAGFPASRVELGLDRLTSLDGASLRLASAPARLHDLGTFDGKTWMERGDLALEPGANDLPLAGRAASAVALTFEGVARPDVPAASVAEVSVVGSGVGPRAGASRLVVAYPRLSRRQGALVGERFGDRAHLSGWAESPAGPGAVEIDGAPVSVDGAYALTLQRPAGSTGSWSVALRARFPDGSESVKVISLDDDRSGEIDGGEGAGATGAEDVRFGAENATAWGQIGAGGGRIGLGTEVSLEVPEGAVGAATRFGISRKGYEVVPLLDAGMVNVSAPAHFAYRFLPRGQTFAKAVKITLPYDPDLLPEGMLPEEIQTYYYDEDQRRWMTLPRREVRRDRRQIVSETTHFTFMINAVLVLPDHPGPVSFNPNSLKDLKAADPSAGMDLVEPPAANSQGTASVAFPVRLPKGRGAYQPSLGLAYDSGGGSGWVGVGWDLPVSSISIDTRYGVPLYDGEERYALDGAQFVPLAAPLACVDGSSGRGYMARVERDFRRVARCGADATQYWFEVTDKAGTLFVYGQGSNARLSSYLPHLFAIPRYPPAFDVGQWMLERVVDANGNLTRYLYQHDNRDGDTGVQAEDFRQIYLSDVFYTGRGRRADGSVIADGPYHVRLSHLSPGGAPAVRSDLVTSGRLGFKTMTRRLLGSIRVEMGSTPIREYVLSYEEGDFGKSRLRAVETRGANGSPFHQHRFEYTSKVAEALLRTGRVAAFGGPSPWNEPDGDDGDAFTASRNSGAGGHFFGGLSIGPSKGSGTIGVALDGNVSRSKTDATFLDVNGDGLPDRMYRSGGAWLNRPPRPGATGALTVEARPGDPAAPAAGYAFALPGGASLGSETSGVFSAAVQVMGFSVSGSFGGSYSTTESRDLVLDANGDGLPDLFADGQVWFNQPRCSGAGGAGACFQRGIPAPALQTPEIPIPQLANDPTLAATHAAAADALAPEDVVLEWNAPFAGDVDVSGALQFTRQPLLGGRHDGVRLRIYRWQHLVAEYVKYPDDAGPTAVAQRLVLGQGDVLYFVLSTLRDFPIADQPPQPPYSPEEVGFAPVIAYAFVEEHLRELTDPAGNEVFRYDAARDFRLAGDPKMAITVPRSGRIRITSTLQKYPSSDHVLACAQYFNPGEYSPTAASCKPGDPIYLTLDARDDLTLTPGIDRDVEAGGTFVFWVQSTMSIDPDRVQWRISGEMTCVRDGSGSCVTPGAEEREILTFQAQPYTPLHLNVRKRDGRPFDWYEPDPQVLIPFVPPVAGRLRFDARGIVGGSIFDQILKRTFPVSFAVRSPDRVHWKAFNDFTVSGVEVDLAPNVPVFFEAHGELDFDTVLFLAQAWFRPEGSSAWFPVPVYPASTTCRRDGDFEFGLAPVLSAGFHGWRYGIWQGREGEAFLPWVFRSLPQGDADDWKGDKDEVRRREKAKMKDPNSPQRLRARLMAILAPNPAGTSFGPNQPGLRPGEPAWTSQDGNVYVFRGGMNAGKRGGTVNGPRDGQTIAANFGIGDVGRTSVATTVTGGVSVGPFSLSLSTGMSHQKEDLLDLNGDRIPDLVVSGALPDVSGLTGDGLLGFLGGGGGTARITDPALLTPRNSVSLPIRPRLNLDVSGQVGLGITEAVKLLSSKSKVNAVAGRMPDLSLGGGVGMNVSTTVEDLVDVNGDGLPDAVRRSDACGGFAVRLNLGNAFARGEDCIGTQGWGGNVLTGVAGQLDPTGAGNPDDDEDTARSLGLAGGMLGFSRDAGAIRQATTVTVQGSLGGGGAIDQYESYGFSHTSESSLAATNVVLTDVTGDGLPDFVSRPNSGGDFLVMVNLGYGFAPPQRWAAPAWPAGYKPKFQVSSAGVLTAVGAVLEGFASAVSDGIDPVEATGTHGILPTTGFVFTIAFPLTIAGTPWAQLSFGGNAALGRETGFELGLLDIDGDGLPDHVLKTGRHEPVLARVNRLAGGNLLKRVERPLGGSFDLEYARAGNTVDMPENRWVLARVAVHDGVAAGTGHDLVTRYEYAGGRLDRNEREFLGFATVTRTNPDDTRVAQTFLNGDFRHKGLLVREVVLDQHDRVFVETVNAYGPPRLVSGAPAEACLRHTPVNLRYPGDLYCEASFVPLLAVEKRSYEGEPSPGVASRRVYDYDAFGNVKTLDDEGDLADPGDDLHATVTYGPPEAADIHCVGAPTDILVTDKAGKTLRKRTGGYDSHCNLKSLRSLVAEGGPEAEATLDWYLEGHASAGSLAKVTSPPNQRGERYFVNYEYDAVIGAHLVRAGDAHGYVSTADYDFRFGESTYTQDLTGQETRREFDEFGRLRKLAAPGFTLASPTIEILYAHEARVARALTRNSLPQGGTLDTVVAMDGVGRVIQTKKTAEIWTGTEEATAVGWAVTGHQRFDAMGRVAEQGQTFFEPGAVADWRPGIPKNPTRFTYDVLGRTLQSVEPNGAITRIDHAFGIPAGTGITRLAKKATDALGKARVVYQDASERTVAMEEHVEGRAPTTHYLHDPLGQLIGVKDAAGNPTSATYDLLGRRTTIENPDVGRVVLTYDLAGNVVRKEDANLREQRQAITYEYDFERVKAIHYPNARRDVVYAYGPPGASENAAGRIARVTDEVGQETRGYDVLGNLARSTRTIEPLRPGDRTRTFTTTFQFDVFGRMLSMAYPDGEVLRYGYDRGGLLQTARGERAATKQDLAQFETYLAKLLYDEFGQRVHQRVGNGVVSRYGYDPLTRRLASLHTRKPGERLMQNLIYAHDLVGNVTEVSNALGEAVPPHAGTVSFAYRYDDLHRLTYAHGEAKSRPRTLDTFTSNYGYSDIHNLLSNVQVHHVLHGATGGGEFPPHTNHEFEYRYDGPGPHRATRIGDTWLVYDRNGNTLRECRDPADSTCTERPSHLRRYLWTEENRLDAVIDGGGRNISRFFYDADGQRIAKLGRGGESITIGQFWSLKGRRAATKHVFAGSTRIASKLLPPPGWDDVPRGPSDATLTATVTATAASNDNGCVPSNYQPQKCPILPGGDPVLNDYYADTKVRPETYYYHPDHLGSTSWVTDQNARVHERVEYFPYGEVWRDPRSDVGASPVKGQRFLFTGKELDEETGLYYFGSRYYDPVRVRWVSPDPILDRYLDGAPNGGVFHPVNLALFAYASLNPLILVDPNGLYSWSQFGKDAGTVGWGLVKGAAWGVAGGLAVAALVTVGTPVALAGAAVIIGYGAYQAINAGVGVATGTTLEGQQLNREQRLDVGGQIVGGFIGGAAGYRGGMRMAAGEPLIPGPTSQTPTPSVETPYGPAVQSSTPEALSLRTAVEQGAPVFRQGRFGVQETPPEAQFWAPRSPAETPGYAEQYGMRGGNTVDWIMQGRVRPGSNFVTRPAPALGKNPGGALEVVTDPGAVQIEWFHMP